MMIRTPSAVAVILMLGAAVPASGCSEPEPAAEPTAEPTAGATSPSADGPGCQDFEEMYNQQPVEPGGWCLQAAGAADAPYAVVDMPAGYDSWNGFVERAAEPYGSVMYWTVESVYKDPCTRAGGPVDPGPSVRDLADALGRQKITDTTEPVPVTLDGHDGLYMELTFPAEMDFTPCLERELYVWEGDGQVGARWEDYLGVVDSYWILDVDGQRVVLVAARPPALPEGELTELKGIVESAQFVESG